MLVAAGARISPGIARPTSVGRGSEALGGPWNVTDDASRPYGTLTVEGVRLQVTPSSRRDSVFLRMSPNLTALRITGNNIVCRK